jgi:hypothetical protein
MPQKQFPVAGAPPATVSDDAALLAHAEECALPSGKTIWWCQPDELALMAFTGDMPDPLSSTVMLYLREEGSLPADEDDPASYIKQRQHLKAEYEIIRQGMAKPRFDPDKEFGDDDVWGRRNLSPTDRTYIITWLFRIGRQSPAYARQPARIPQPLGAAPDVLDGDGGGTIAGSAVGD